MNTTSIVNGRSSQMHLNFDTLVFVGHWIEERKDLLSFISTCSDLYRTGVPTLLGFHYRITTKNLVAFYNFLVSKSPSSFLGLRNLEFHFPEQYVRRNRTMVKTGPNEISMITDILIHAKKIRNIKIYGNVMDSEPTVFRALAALQALEVLDLSRCNDSKTAIIAALRLLRSPLIRLDLKFSGQDEDMLAAISNFCRTLERLAVSDFAFPKATRSNLSYPNLTYLRLASIPNMQLSILIPALPNLEHLVVKYADDFSDEINLVRDGNLLFQQEHPTQTWHLSSLTGDASSLYALGLQAAVHTVAITCVTIRRHEHAPGLLVSILAPLRPLSLSMVSQDEFDEPIFEMGWLAREVTHGCRGLVRLDLELTLQSDRPDHEHQARIDTLFAQLGLVSASNPGLIILSIAFPIDGQPMPNEEYPVTVFANQMDMRLLATRALLAVPTLSMAKFSTWSEVNSRQIYSYWSYNQDGELSEAPVESHASMENALNKRTKSYIETYDRVLAESIKTD